MLKGSRLVQVHHRLRQLERAVNSDLGGVLH
jgi:hypothetical protein